MIAKFAGGKNFAMKVPPYQYEATVAFHRDLMGLERIGGPNDDAVGFRFGPNLSLASFQGAAPWCPKAAIRAPRGISTHSNTSAVSEIISSHSLADPKPGATLSATVSRELLD